MEDAVDRTPAGTGLASGLAAGPAGLAGPVAGCCPGALLAPGPAAGLPLPGVPVADVPLGDVLPGAALPGAALLAGPPVAPAPLTVVLPAPVPSALVPSALVPLVPAPLAEQAARTSADSTASTAAAARGGRCVCLLSTIGSSWRVGSIPTGPVRSLPLRRRRPGARPITETAPDAITAVPIPVFRGSRKLRIHDRDGKTSEEGLQVNKTLA